MNILWLSWKDEDHPHAGGAEVVSSQIRKRLVKDGHPVKLLTSRPKGLKNYELNRDGVEVYRSGGRFGVYIKAFFAYRKIKKWPDLIIDEMNTIPFGAGLYTKKIPIVLLAYQLAREVWLYQMPHPFSYIGYLLEPIYLRLMPRRYSKVLTESQSTKNDLQMYNFPAEKIAIFRVGMALKPTQSISIKRNQNSVVILGSVRPMKRTLEAIKAFELAASHNPDLTLKVAGDHSGRYGDKVIKHIVRSPHRNKISLLGRITSSEKIKLLKSSSIIIITSVKEGWGLIVTEANSQGVVGVVLDVDGLRDSVKDGITGIICKDIPEISDAITELTNNRFKYKQLQKNAWDWSKEFTFNNSYQDFKESLNISDVVN